MMAISREQSERSAPRWIRPVLIAAGVYNLIYGALVVLMPQMSLGWLIAAPLVAAQSSITFVFWQCIGMIVGVYGIGYLIAAHDSVTHWPIILVGFLGKVLGPIGFAWGVTAGTVPASFGLNILTNDLIWLIPFVMILYRAWKAQTEPIDIHVPHVADAMKQAVSQDGRTLWAMTWRQPVLVVFLRHFGCTFCRETLATLQQKREALRAQGFEYALVHMVDDTTALRALKSYGLSDVMRFSDPDRVVYRAFGLQRGTLGQLFGWRLRGLAAGIFRRHGVGSLQGDGFQMPGAFVVANGEIQSGYRHRVASDQPDYDQLCAVEITHQPAPTAAM